uniref:Uncharacterized protein n=1 Tax=Vitis vinifera TaxID=29760 RepID=A5C2H8_VITVI|nr:hypothetical protein VITISV_023885 [Vitis vinifera]
MVKGGDPWMGFALQVELGLCPNMGFEPMKKNVRPREGVERTNKEKFIKLLTAREFRERFRVLGRIAIRLMNDGPMSTEEESFNVIIFSKEQYNVELCFPLPSLFKQFLHFTKIPPAFLHLNAVRILMGYSILNMLYHLDLSLLEVLFVYTVKMSKKEFFSLSAHIPSLQLVIGLPNSTKVASKEHIVVSGPWAGSYEHPTHAFEPHNSLGIPGLLLTRLMCITGKRRRDQLVEWVDKISFDSLNKLFVIFASERNHETLLIDQNLLALVRDSESYIVPTLPRFAFRVLEDSLNQDPELVVSYINLKHERKEKIALRLKVNFKERHHKHLFEALLVAPLPAKKSHPEAPREESAPCVPIDVVGFGQELVVILSIEDTCRTEDATSSATLGGIANEKETLVNLSSWEDIVTLLKSVPCFTTLEPQASGVNAFFSMTRCHFVELLDEPCLASVVRPSHGTPKSVLRCTYPMQKYTTKETTKVGVAVIHNLMRQRSSLLKRLEVAESMLAFLTRQIDNNEELRVQLVRVESELIAVRKVIADAKKLLKELEEMMEATKVEACQNEKENEAAEAKCKDADQEIDQLKKELEELRVSSEAKRKELEELWSRFTIEKRELEEDYQKQVDEMFFFGYQCCMRKNDITHDIPHYPFNEEEDATVNGPAQGDKYLEAPSPSNGQ